MREKCHGNGTFPIITVLRFRCQLKLDGSKVIYVGVIVIDVCNYDGWSLRFDGRSNVGNIGVMVFHLG